jgi:hypothetical protein
MGDYKYVKIRVLTGRKSMGSSLGRDVAGEMPQVQFLNRPLKMENWRPTSWEDCFGIGACVFVTTRNLYQLRAVVTIDTTAPAIPVIADRAAALPLMRRKTPRANCDHDCCCTNTFKFCHW